MKILFISLPSIHAVRWIENLVNTRHELFWFDVTQKGALPTNIEITQFTNWSKRKLPQIKGEYTLSKKAPVVYEKIQPLFEVTANQKLQEIIAQVQPDIVHSFNLQTSAYPVLKTMLRNPSIPWVYSCWGSDLYYYKQFPAQLKKIKKVLQRADYFHADCKRDFTLAKQLGYTGKETAVIPGGGGYDLQKYAALQTPFDTRNTIVVKGYQHLFGRALHVIKALKQILPLLQGVNVVVFGAHNVVIDYIHQNNLPFAVYDRHGLAHEEVLQWMGKAMIYIGNNISDGIPNTLLEAMAMGAFPIQSNPGNATAELIVQGENGLLIQNPEAVDEIAKVITQALEARMLRKKAKKMNQQIAFDYLDYSKNQQKIIALYQNIKDA